MKEYFSGEINGYNASDLYGMIDYDKQMLDNRMEVVNDIVDTGFFDAYYSEYYDAICKKDTPLSEDNNICMLLERLATYLLMSEEEKVRRKELDESHHSFEGLIKKINRDASLESIASDTELADVIIYNLDKRDVPKIAENKKIKVKSLTEDNLSDIIEYIGLEDENKKVMLESYVRAYNSLNYDDNSKINIDRVKYSIRKDIETLLESEYPDVEHSNLVVNSDDVYFESVVDMNYKHNLLGITFYNERGSLEYQPGLLFHHKPEGIDIDDELGLLLHELDGIIEDSGLSDREAMVLEYLRKGVKMGDIAEKLNKSARTITRDKQKIVNKVFKQIRSEDLSG